MVEVLKGCLLPLTANVDAIKASTDLLEENSQFSPEERTVDSQEIIQVLNNGIIKIDLIQVHLEKRSLISQERLIVLYAAKTSSSARPRKKA